MMTADAVVARPAECALLGSAGGGGGAVQLSATPED